MVVAGIRIDQALFGYREGHKLLQASRKFVPATERGPRRRVVRIRKDLVRTRNGTTWLRLVTRACDS
jgi:hypothetical protein